MYHGIAQSISHPACIHPNKLRFKIRDKPFVPNSSDQAAVPEGRSKFTETCSSVFKSEIIVGYRFLSDELACRFHRRCAPNISTGPAASRCKKESQPGTATASPTCQTFEQSRKTALLRRRKLKCLMVYVKCSVRLISATRLHLVPAQPRLLSVEAIGPKSIIATWVFYE